MQELVDSDVGVTTCSNEKWIVKIQLGIFGKWHGYFWKLVRLWAKINWLDIARFGYNDRHFMNMGNKVLTCFPCRELIKVC